MLPVCFEKERMSGRRDLGELSGKVLNLPNPLNSSGSSEGERNWAVCCVWALMKRKLAAVMPVIPEVFCEEDKTGAAILCMSFDEGRCQREELQESPRRLNVRKPLR